MNDPAAPKKLVALVEIRGLTKAYVRGKQSVEVLHGIDLDIPEGDFVALMGPSGCGKSTLLHLCGAMDRASAFETPAKIGPAATLSRALRHGIRLSP